MDIKKFKFKNFRYLKTYKQIKGDSERSDRLIISVKHILRKEKP